MKCLESSISYPRFTFPDTPHLTEKKEGLFMLVLCHLYGSIKDNDVEVRDGWWQQVVRLQICIRDREDERRSGIAKL